jgi:hypothetical protein
MSSSSGTTASQKIRGDSKQYYELLHITPLAIQEEVQEAFERQYAKYNPVS